MKKKNKRELLREKRLPKMTTSMHVLSRKIGDAKARIEINKNLIAENRKFIEDKFNKIKNVIIALQKRWKQKWENINQRRKNH